MYEAICDICGKAFTSYRSDAKRCSEPCRREYRRAFGREHRRRWRAENPELNKQQYQQWYKEKGVAYHKQWRDTHPEYRKHAIERAIKRNKERPDEKRRYDAVSYQRHKKQRNAQVKAYAQVNRERLRPFKHAALIRYRARKARAEGNFTAKQFRELCEACDWRCAYCHQRFDKLTADHVTPLSRGGSNDIANIIPACLSCNASKQDKTPLEYLTCFTPPTTAA